mmetsp:Transcript_24393/g.68517  ORF Transcript_24393/g.68517 Transcript_24393/m.68517 type:complete len:242 (-) Transcript_24393:14-739(-)
MNSSALIGWEKSPKVPSQAAFCPSGLIAAVQSVSVTTLNPFSKAVRMVDSTQQLVRKPPRATVVMLSFLRISSRSVSGNASRPLFPETTRSDPFGFISSQISAFHEPAVKSFPSAQPFRIPRFLFGLSEPSSASEMGTWITFPPAFRTASAVLADFSSMPVSSMTAFTPPFSLPSACANSFWYSIRTSPKLFASMASPPCADEAGNVRKPGMRLRAGQNLPRQGTGLGAELTGARAGMAAA